MTEKLLRSAENGNAEAQTKLGLCCYKGDGVPQDSKEAVRRFRLAAQQGNVHAQFYLGRAYSSGDGVPKDCERAYAWLETAAAQGHKKAAEWRTIVMKEMTREQISEGKMLSQENVERTTQNKKGL